MVCRDILHAQATCHSLKMNLLVHMAGVCRANRSEESHVKKSGGKELHMETEGNEDSATETECHRSSRGRPVLQLNTDQCASAEKAPTTEER